MTFSSKYFNTQAPLLLMKHEKSSFTTAGEGMKSVDTLIFYTCTLIFCKYGKGHFIVNWHLFDVIVM